MKVYKDMLIKIGKKEYLVCYKTKLGFISESIKASTFKDWLGYCLFKMRYKLRKYKWY